MGPIKTPREKAHLGDIRILYIPITISTFEQESWISTWVRGHRRKVVELGARWIWRRAEGKDLGSGCGSGGLRANMNNSLDVNRPLSWGRSKRKALKSYVRRLSFRRQGPIVTLHPPRLEKRKNSAEQLLKIIPWGQEVQKQNLVHLLLNAKENHITVEGAVENSRGKRIGANYIYSSRVSLLEG